MLGPLSPDRPRIEDSCAPEPTFVEQRVRPVTERAPQPCGDRHAEPLLRTIYERPWDVAIENLSENPFARPVPDLEAKRQLPRELDDTVIEQRNPRLETHTHARAIHLDEDVVGQVADEIEIHRLVLVVRTNHPRLAVGGRARRIVGPQNDGRRRLPVGHEIPMQRRSGRHRQDLCGLPDPLAQVAFSRDSARHGAEPPHERPLVHRR